MKKTIIIFVAAVVAILFLVFLFVFARNFYLIKTGQLIEWQGKWYTMEEIREIYPPQVYEVESKNNPEEVYTQFREALLGDDLETALSLIREESREKYREAFGDKEKLTAWIERLPENITKEDEYGNFSYYNLDMGGEYKNEATFIKNKDGYWQIDII